MGSLKVALPAQARGEFFVNFDLDFQRLDGKIRGPAKILKSLGISGKSSGQTLENMSET